MKAIALFKEIESRINCNDFQGISYQEARSLIRLSPELNYYLRNLAEIIHSSNIVKQDLCGSLYVDLRPCPEDCSFCPLSVKHFNMKEKLEVKSKNISDEIIKFSRLASKRGLSHFKIVVTGLSIRKDIQDKIKDGIFKAKVNHPNIKICLSGGILSRDLLNEFKLVGVDIYNCNLETSARYFPYLVKSHSQDQKIQTINNAKKVGLEICSGGIIGLGESAEDRINMAFKFKELGIYSSPLNLFINCNELSLNHLEINRLSEDDILNTLALYRLINPNLRIVLGAGREIHMSESSIKRALCIGASALQVSGIFSKKSISNALKIDKKFFGDILNG